ncbi:MAG: ATP-binding protein [Sphingobium sp.]|nr:MAG: ATP-binding protein [Sphingobium sp.]
MPLPTTIHSAVSPEAIRRASRLFSGDSWDCLHEIFQNARRAGATCIAVDRTERLGHSLLHIRDDGCGIDDPAALLMLGHSGWSNDIARCEDPAGMGMFSLAGRAVEIQSFSPCAGTAWKVQIPADAWDSGAPLALGQGMIDQGTLISIEMPDEWIHGLHAAVADAARHFPIPVTLNGAMLLREDFLKDAMFVEQACGCRIGVYDQDPDWQDGRRINFHGHRVKCALPTVREEKDNGSLWTVRIDIMDAPEIHMVLPARKEVIDNAALMALREAAERIIFKAIATRPDHRLPFAAWQRACELGVTLPQARSGLSIWRPQTADDCHECSRRMIAPEGAVLIVPSLEPDIAQALALARGKLPIEDVQLVEAEDALQGYAWYDTLPVIRDISLRIDREGTVHRYDEDMCLPADFACGLVDRIVIELTVCESGRKDASHSVHSIEIPALVCRNGGLDIEEAIILATRDGGITPDRLSRMIYATIFCAADDRDCDSWDTQSRSFEREARQHATHILLGEDAATLEAINMSAWDNLSWLIPLDRKIVIHAERGSITVDFLPN